MSTVTFTKKASQARASARTAALTAQPGGLRLGAVDDAYEREADRLADEVMTGGSLARHWSLTGLGAGAAVQRCSCGGAADAGGECEECKAAKERGTVQRQASGDAQSAVAPPIVRDVVNSPGRPLDPAARAFFEPRFGYDFSRVRVHTDGPAPESASAVQALAYTVGDHIVFNAGRYAPSGSEGRRLLAHELAHTIQQGPMLYRQQGPDRQLPPHDPRAHTPAAGACYGSAICQPLLTPTKLLAEAAAKPVNKDKRDARKQVCGKNPPDPACTAGGHGAPATHAAKLLHDYDPSRPVAGVKMLIDKDLEQDFGALTILCSTFVPPVSGATDCITIPEKMEKEAEQFNTTMVPTIDGMERGKWRERTLEILVHESEHTRFREAFRKDAVLGTLPACGNNADAVSAMNELAAMLTEFKLRMERIRGSVGLSPADREAEMDEWRARRILRPRQSITVSLRTVRCVCQCDDANKMIKETIEFTTASWSQQEKNDLHREMRDPKWKDLDLRWPFVAPPNPSVRGI